MPDSTPHSQPPSPKAPQDRSTGYKVVCDNTPSTVSLTAEVGFTHIGNSSLKGQYQYVKFWYGGAVGMVW